MEVYDWFFLNHLIYCIYYFIDKLLKLIFIWKTRLKKKILGGVLKTSIVGKLKSAVFGN